MTRGLVAVCLLVAPALGLTAAGAAENPPGRGPGALQVVLAVVVAAGVALVAIRGRGLPWATAVRWAFAAVLALPVLFVVVVLLVILATPL